ncbi:MAG: error-prone DNA polymerase [Sandaracinaceae bacterium]|nr:error-prone DNA polymerase [Sandaracinaceae bacterium]
MTAGRYVPLWVKSNGSLLEGASHPEELVDRAAELGLGALAITDRDSMNGLVRAWTRAKERGVRVICGAQVSVAPPGGGPARRVVVLARTREGYGRLCRALTLGHARRPKGESLVEVRELADAADGNVLCALDAESLEWLAEPFRGRAYALVARHRHEGELATEAALRASAKALGVPLVAAIEVLYHHRRRRFLADVLACVRHGTTLDAAGRRLRPNAEHALPSPAEMARRFADLPDAVARTLEVAERAAFELSELRYRYPAEHLPEGESERSWLTALTWQGARARFGEDVPAPMRRQLERELAVIEELEYGGYFLTMWDIVQFCRRHDILCQGRGSAANSAVCFCLGITAIDPVRMDLLFERFLSRERAEPPDIDLDIEHDRREEVIQYVYERWGRRRAAMVANVVRYRTKSAVRDVGKALGLPATALDMASKLSSGWGEPLAPEVLAQAGLDLGARRVRQLRRLVDELQSFPRHLSVHPGGFLLGAEPIDTLCPVEPATMPGRTVVQWDKQDVEDLGLFKVDLLGLGMLTQIHRCFELLRAHEGVELTIATVPAEDPATYEMIGRADTVGVFQIESRAQMSMLPRLRPKTFYDLVIEVAIVRPGPIQGDMVHPYLRRREGVEPVTYPHPSLARILDKTLGVPIFQEQVMKLAVEAAGYTPGEADQLRRDIAAWRSRGRIDEHEERLVGRMIARGIPRDFAERVFSQIRGFGEYGFPESHAASFALLSYVTAWLKCHHHDKFTCALLNAWPMGFYQPSTLVEDARRHGVEVLPIDVNESAWECTLERSGGGPHGHAVRMGLRFVKGLGERERARLEAAPPPYADLADFARRAALGKRALEALARAGALRRFGLDRRDALWAVRGLSAHAKDALDLAPRDAPEARFRPLVGHEEVSWDYAASLHSARGHPMARLRPALRARGVPDAATLNAMAGRRRVTYVGMVICRQRPGTASGVTFMTLEDETGFVNLVVWRDVFERYAMVARGAAVIEVEGALQREHGVVHLVAERFAVPRLGAPTGETPRSRNFH